MRHGSKVYTDELQSYDELNTECAHRVVNHAESYVDGAVHTNRMGNFCSLLKRSIKRTYVSVEPFHLYRYFDKKSFRFNESQLTAKERFELVLRSVAGKRLTWDVLTRQEAE